jgi:hypothetical protein
MYAKSSRAQSQSLLSTTNKVHRRRAVGMWAPPPARRTAPRRTAAGIGTSFHWGGRRPSRGGQALAAPACTRPVHADGMSIGMLPPRKRLLRPDGSYMERAITREGSDGRAGGRLPGFGAGVPSGRTPGGDSCPASQGRLGPQPGARGVDHPAAWDSLWEWRFSKGSLSRSSSQQPARPSTP